MDELSAEFPIRLTTGRRLDSYNTGVQSGQYATPIRRPETLNLSPEDAEQLGMAEGEVVRVSSRRGSLEVPVHLDEALRAGLAFMTLHFPDQVATNVLTLDAWDPKSGTAEFKATAIRVDKLEAPPLTAARASARRRAPSGSAAQGRGAGDRRGTGGCRLGARAAGVPAGTAGIARRPTGTSRSAATRRGPGGICCCRCCTRCRTGSAGSARERSITSAPGSPSRPPRRTGWHRSTRSSAPGPLPLPSSTSATTSPAGSTARSRYASRWSAASAPRARRPGPMAPASPGSAAPAWASATAARRRMIQQQARSRPGSCWRP